MFLHHGEFLLSAGVAKTYGYYTSKLHVRQKQMTANLKHACIIRRVIINIKTTTYINTTISNIGEKQDCEAACDQLTLNDTSCYMYT